MHAIVITEPGGPEVLQWSSVPDPVPRPGEVRIAVRATAVNRLDLLQRKGLYPAPAGYPQDIPGVEFSGVVESVGPDVVSFHLGDRVFGLSGGGTYAELVISDELMLMPIPEGMSFTEAAAVPEAFITAYDAMISQAGLCAGETVLISAIGSGVGLAAMQIATAIGARPIGTSRAEDKIATVKKLGLSDALPVSESAKFADRVLELTNNRGANVVLELVGGRYLAEDLRCAAYRGRIMIVGLVGGSSCEADLATILRKRLTIRGTTLRSRPLEEKISVTERFATDMLPLLADGTIKPVIDRIFPIEQAAETHKYVANDSNFGKVVLQVAAE